MSGLTNPKAPIGGKQYHEVGYELALSNLVLSFMLT